jgi:enoyl-CoA hydratase/carnithine racemase
LALSTEPVSAQTALAMGIVSQVLPGDTLDGVVANFVRRLLSMPQPALEAVKEYASLAPELGSRGALQLARNLHATVNSSAHVKKRQAQPQDH